MVDGERIDGAWCHVWRRYRADADYYVDDLIVFADGTITCGERTDLAGLGRMLATGRLAVTRPDAPPLPDEPSKWASRHGEPLTPEGFLLDVSDRIEAFNERPTAGQRCRDAIRRFQQERPSPTGHFSDGIPGGATASSDLCPRRHGPSGPTLRILLTDIGEPVDGDGPVVTAKMHQDVLNYFNAGDQGVQSEKERRAAQHSDDPSEPGRPALISHETVYPQGWPEEPGLFMLRNDFPAQIVFAGECYASVLHGYWAWAAADDADRRRIRDAASGREAHDLGGQVKHRTDWPEVRLAVMAGLLRAKFTQHPALGQVLVSTEDARISYTGLSDSPFWRDVSDGRGRNWIGRLLELTRSELAAQRLLRFEEPGVRSV